MGPARKRKRSIRPRYRDRRDRRLRLVRRRQLLPLALAQPAASSSKAAAESAAAGLVLSVPAGLSPEQCASDSDQEAYLTRFGNDGDPRLAITLWVDAIADDDRAVVRDTDHLA